MAVRRDATKAVETVEEVKPVPEAMLQMTQAVRSKTFADKLKAEKLCEVTVSPLYAPEFSRNQPVSINGVRINVPTDGKVYKVPESFAMIINERKRAADEKFKRLNKMADVTNNKERNPGELKLFR